ncbi:MAG: phosphatase PAP2 family protein [Halanaerobiales bacterium]
MNESTYKNILNFLHNRPILVKLLQILNKFITSVVYVLYPGLLILLIYRGDMRFWKVFLVPGTSFVLVSVFRKHYNASRPYEVMDIIPVINKNTEGRSFPSRHVFSVFIIAMAFYYIYPSAGAVLMVVGLILAFLRVIVGVHYPRDVIGGIVIGILSGMVGLFMV